MRTKISLLLQMSTVAALGLLGACTSPTDGSSIQALTDMGCTVNTPDPRACDPAGTKKTTVCHIPPGNPANAHTICVGNAAVPAHLDHGDFVGTCSCDVDVDGGVGDTVDAGGGDTPDATIEVPE
jgi:hypothetical protein